MMQDQKHQESLIEDKEEITREIQDEGMGNNL